MLIYKKKTMSRTFFGVKRYTEDGKEVDAGVHSVFRQNIQNTAGIDQIQAQAQLKMYALSDSNGYTQERSKVYIAVLREMVQRNYDIIWDLLSQGKYPTAGGTTAQIVMGKDWKPGYPEQEINDLAQGFSVSIKEAFEKLMKEVMPDDYKNMAEDRQKNIAKVGGAIARTTETSNGSSNPLSSAAGGSGSQ